MDKWYDIEYEFDTEGYTSGPPNEKMTPGHVWPRPNVDENLLGGKDTPYHSMYKKIFRWDFGTVIKKREALHKHPDTIQAQRAYMEYLAERNKCLFEFAKMLVDLDGYFQEE